MAFARALSITATAAHTTTVVGADDPTKEVNKDQWNGTAAHSVAASGSATVSGADVGGIPYCPTATTEVTSANLTWAAATGQGLAMVAGTATTDVAAMSLTRTNNNAAVATGVKWTYTDTTSAAGFLPFQILGGAAGTTNLLSLSKTGLLTTGAGIISGANLILANSSYIAAGTAANQLLSLYGTDADALGTQIVIGAGGLGAAMVRWGGTAATFPAIKRSTTVLQARLADDSAAATWQGKYNSSDGTAGVASFGPAAVASITVKDGIITAIS